MVNLWLVTSPSLISVIVVPWSLNVCCGDCCGAAVGADHEPPPPLVDDNACLVYPSDAADDLRCYTR